VLVSSNGYTDYLYNPQTEWYHDSDNLIHFVDYFFNNTLTGVSAACERPFNFDFRCKPNFYPSICFPDYCLLPGGPDEFYRKNISCARECSAYFYSNIAKAIKFQQATVSTMSTTPYPKWIAFADDISYSLPGVLVRATIVYSPIRSNAKLSQASESRLTSLIENKDPSPDALDDSISADFSSLLFESGISGLYIIRFSVDARNPVDPGFLLFNVSNPIQEVKVTYNYVSLTHSQISSYASVSAIARVVELSNIPLVRVCAIPENGRSLSSLSPTVIVRLLSDPVSAISLEVRPPTQKINGAAWNSMLRTISEKGQRFVWAENGADEDRIDASAGMSATMISASNASQVQFDPRERNIQLDADGCVEFSQIRFSSIGLSQRVAIVFSVLGVEGPPVVLDLVTLIDANPVTTESLQNQIAIPLLIMMPAFGANSQLLGFRTRALCLLFSFIGLSAMAGTSGVEFISSLTEYY